MKPSALNNYRDLSVREGTNAGLQFQFYCKCCDFTWNSPVKPLRSTRTLGLLSKLSDLAGLFGSSDVRSLAIKTGSATRFAAGSAGDKAYKEALAAAQDMAVRYFEQCTRCGDVCCENCLDGSGVCTKCRNQDRQTSSSEYADHGGGSHAGAGGMACPNCQTPATGGRFCHECGFDMASTHKSCPTCGSVMPRAARFCTDCGHGF